MSTQGLTAPGSAQYNSPEMTVGDGTWDSQHNTFLLPNLQGLNLAMTQYNGMGNRFAQMPGYTNLIKAHGILAAIVFLFIVPFAIMFNRFYGRNPWTAIRIHIWCQIMTMFLTTVLLILGFMAVGPERSLTNPHHAVGVAIYTLIWWQFIVGWWVHRREKRRRLPYPTVTAVIHKWSGRATALLGLAQVPMGLALFGSPEYLFILYALVVFAIVVVYFIYSYMQERNHGREMDDHISEHSYHYEDGHEKRTHRFSNLAKGAAAGVGISALANRLRHRREVASSRHSGSDSVSVEEDKYSQYGQRPTEGLGRRNILGLGALAAVSYWFGKVFARRKNRRDAEDMSSGYSETSEDSTERIERVEEGRPSTAGPPAVVASPGPSPRPNQPLNPTASHVSHASHRRTASEMSEESYVSGSPSKERRGHGVRNAIAGLGTFAFARSYLKRRQEKKEQKRIDELREQDRDDERIQRASSRKYTGDGYLHRPGRLGSVTSTNLTADPGGPEAAGALGDGIAATAAHNREVAAANSRLAVQNTNVADPFVSDPLPPPPPPHSVHGSSGSEVYASSGGHDHRRHHNLAEVAAVGAGASAVGLAAGEALAQRRQRSESRRRSNGADSMGSQPVSVKLNMHSDGRHVTLRRLTEEEAAAERARQARNRNRQRRRAGSASSLGSPDGGGDRWRRTEAQKRREQQQLNQQQQQQQQVQQQVQQQRPQPQPQPQQQLYAPPAIPSAPQRLQPQPHYPNNNASSVTFSPPPPPPMPGSDPRLAKPGPSSVGSPGTYDGNLTETSTNYENNRRRRRAERAAAAREKQARVARGDFS